MRAAGRDSAATETIRRSAALVDERTGIIQYLFERPIEPDEPQVFGYGSLLADTTRIGVAEAGALNGSTSIVRERALAAAVGEAVERYSARFVPEGQLLLAPCQELTVPTIDPCSLVLYSEEQYTRPGFPYGRVDDATPLRWVWGMSLTRGVRVLAPAFAVYIPYEPAPSEPAVVEQTTNGLACGSTHAAAVLSGLCEVVERHAVMSMWLRGEAGARLECADVTNPVLAETLRRFARVSYDVRLIDVTADMPIPVVVAAAIDSSGKGPAATFASAAGVFGEHAALAALEELAQCVPWIKSLTSDFSAANVPQLDAVSTIEDHVLWATSLDRLPLVDFVVASAAVSTPSEMPSLSADDEERTLDRLVSALSNLDYEVIVVDVTPPDIQDVGLHVVRVLVPQAQPLYFGRGLERVSPRLRGADLPGMKLPHPFP